MTETPGDRGADGGRTDASVDAAGDVGDATGTPSGRFGAGGEGTGDDGIDALIADLSLPEKVALVHGDRDPNGLATGYLPGNERVGIPSLSMVDGPMGVRAVPATAFPASLALAASWDPTLADAFGEAVATEARAAGQDALLAPGFNVVRVPQCGRAFEYYGEDPHLASRIGVGTIEGIQSGGVMATAKHYLANNQEADRHHVSAEVSERALREIYLPAFEAAVQEADVAAVMAAYNRINGTYAAEHEYLLTEVLKEEWGFSGFVVSDWWATMSCEASANAGLDLDMPGLPVYEWHAHGSPLFAAVGALPDADWVPKRRLGEIAEVPWQPANPNPNVLDESYFDEPLREAVEAGRVAEATLDEKLRRILGQMDRFGLFERGREFDDDGRDGRPFGRVDVPDHHDLAREVAERGTVLLRNEGDVLPLHEDASVALIGPHADEPKVGGGGSSAVDPPRATGPLAGLRARAGPGGTVTFERGIERVGEASTHDSLVPEVRVPWRQPPRIEDAMAAARAADAAVVVVRDLAAEGEDRSLALPGTQDELVTAVAAAADRTVVVLNTAGAVEMPWLDAVDAVLEIWYPGQEDGHALASVLYGDADPGGRLPVTFAASAEDYPAASEEQYPGVDGEAEYSEGVSVGYRHFDRVGVEPLFPFGHGLSYAEFEYVDVEVALAGDLAEGGVDPVDGDDREPVATVSVTVENVADRPGREVVQAYVAPADPPVERPPKELAAFEALEVGTGEATTVTLPLDRRAFAYYDEDAVEWTVAGGEYEVVVGRSSRDERGRVTIAI